MIRSFGYELPAQKFGHVRETPYLCTIIQINEVYEKAINCINRPASYGDISYRGSRF